MSESVSTGMSGGTSSQSTSPSGASASTSSGFSSQKTAAPAGSQASASKQSTNPNPNAQGLNAQSAPAGQQGSETQPTQSPEPKRLGDQDLDALVTVKINGKTQDLPLKEVIKLQQLEQASHEKMRQAAEIQRKAQELLQLDIDRFAQMRGLDLDSLAEERLAKKYELMQMSPEQRRLHELEQREAQRAEQTKSQQKKYLDQIRSMTNELPPGIENASPEQLQAYLAQTQQVYQMTEQNLEREIVEAWKETGLPKNKYFGAMVAFNMAHSKNPDGTPLQAKDAAAKVMNEYRSANREIFGTMDAQAILDFLGPEVMDRIRKHDVQRVTAQHAASIAPPKSPGVEPASGQKKYVNQQEWRRAMGLE